MAKKMNTKLFLLFSLVGILMCHFLPAQTMVSYSDSVLVPVTIPSWFTDIQKGKYVGISMPYGSQTDAIGMAIMQKLFATDLDIWHDSYFSNSQSHTEAGHSSYMVDSCEISINTMVSYDIEELTLLPSKEYLCRITDGNQNRMNISISCKRQGIMQSLKIFSEKESLGFYEWLIRLTFGDSQYKMRLMQSEKVYRKANQRGNEARYMSALERGKDIEKPDYAYQTQCEYVHKAGETIEYQSKYTFQSKPLNLEEILDYDISSRWLDSKQCLAERLLMCYLDKLCGDPDNYRGMLTCKKAPVVKLNYADGNIDVLFQHSAQ